MKYLFRWNGAYFGFVLNGNIFDHSGQYVGWIESDQTVWDRHGNYLGQIVDDCYVLRNANAFPLMSKLPKFPPFPPMKPFPPHNRIAKFPKFGWFDALENT